MSIEVWPFLVSRNRYIDYRTIVAPDFICEAKIPNLLARVAEGELTEREQLFMRKVIGSKADDFTIAFRVIKATEKYINPTGKNNILKDQFGREIYMFEGIVTREIREDFIISEENFQEVRQQLTASYREFWDLVDPPSAIPSQSFLLKKDIVSSRLVLKILDPFEVRTPIPPLSPKPPVPTVPPKPPVPPIKPQVVFFFVLVVIFLVIASSIYLSASARNIESAVKSDPNLNSIVDVNVDVTRGLTKVFLKGSISVNSIIPEENLINFGKISKQTLLKEIEEIARREGATEVDTRDLKINIPLERIGEDGNYDLNGLAKKVKSALENNPEFENVYVAQNGSTVVLKGTISNRALLEKMRKTAEEVKGATKVDTTKVEVE